VSRRTSLREFQIAVAERLRTATSRTALSSRLGFQVAGQNWFVALHQVSEVVPVPTLVGVPLTQPWYRGVANVRGKLYSIVDFSSFHGGEATSAGLERRVILVSDKLVVGAGLLVSRMLGLRNPEHFTPAVRPDGSPPWVGAAYTDASGASWQELDLPALARERRFLEVGNN
jgi:twitching motility protein PilI